MAKEVKHAAHADSDERYKRAIERMVNHYAKKNKYDYDYALWMLVQAGYDFLNKDSFKDNRA